MREVRKDHRPGNGGLPSRLSRFSLLFQDSRYAKVNVSPQDAFAPIRRIGGDTGWYYANWLWWLRGMLDRLVGGIGLRRGRRDPDDIRVGDAIDCWRVQAFEPNRRLRLVLELRYPGSGYLEFEVVPNGTGSVIRQTATYTTGGFWGCLYWYSTFLVHDLLFGGMLNGISAACRPGTGGEKQVAEELCSSNPYE